MSALIKYEMDDDEYTFYMNIEILKEKDWLFNYARLSEKIKFIPILKEYNFKNYVTDVNMNNTHPFSVLISDSFNVDKNTRASMYISTSINWSMYKFYNIINLADLIYTNKYRFENVSDMFTHVVPKNIADINNDVIFKERLYTNKPMEKIIFLPCFKIGYPRLPEIVLPYEFLNVDCEKNICIIRKLKYMDDLYKNFRCSINHIKTENHLEINWSDISDQLQYKNTDCDWPIAFGAWIYSFLDEEFMQTQSKQNQSTI